MLIFSSFFFLQNTGMYKCIYDIFADLLGKNYNLKKKTLSQNHILRVHAISHNLKKTHFSLGFANIEHCAFKMTKTNPPKH